MKIIYLKKIIKQNENTYWKFIKYNTDKCRRRAHTKNNVVVLHKHFHNHTPNAAEIGVKT